MLMTPGPSAGRAENNPSCLSFNILAWAGAASEKESISNFLLRANLLFMSTG